MKKLAILSCFLVLGFATGVPAASAHSASSSHSSSNSNYRSTNHGSSSHSSFDTSGRIRYDSRGNAYWDYGSGSGSNSSNYEYRDDRDNQDDYYDRTSGRNDSSCSSWSTDGRIRYDSRGVAYWDAGSSICR